jgi:DNA primase
MPTDNIEEIKSKIDVVELIQEYIQVKPAGTNNFRALCPFHHEKTPSFMISKDKQIWHCFGCGEGGDIFAFIMKMEGLEFPEALRILAKRAGIQLKYQDPAVQNEKTKLQDICRAAASFYHKILLDHPKAQFVRDYLQKRQVSSDSIETWQLGYAPDAWETLNTYLIQKGFKEDDIFLAGLTIKKEKSVGFYDRFRHRLMFPITDAHGNVIGFGGRWLGDEKDPNAAKYINSPQTLIYDKSRVLFGLDKAKSEIKQKKLAIVVEGYMDCLTSHQAGVTNVVASSGTALTTEQVRLLKRFTSNLAFAFDQDTAGASASKRGIDVAWQQEMSVRIIVLPFGKDPDELIKKDPSLWSKAIAENYSIMDYYFDQTVAKADLSQVEDKKNAAKVLIGIIAKLGDPIEQTHYLQKLSGLLLVDEKVLRDKLKQLTDKKSGLPKKTETATHQAAPDRHVSIAENLIGLAFVKPEYLNYISGQLLPEYIPSETLQALYKKLIIYYTEKQSFDYREFIKTLPKNEGQLAVYADVLTLKAEKELADNTDDNLQLAIESGIKELKKQSIHQRLQSIEQQLRRAEREHDDRRSEEYALAFSELMSELKHLE